MAEVFESAHQLEYAALISQMPALATRAYSKARLSDVYGATSLFGLSPLAAPAI